MISFKYKSDFTTYPLKTFQQVYIILKIKISPGWCDSVDWVPAGEPKGCWFNSQSGHMPGLRARSPVGGAWEATTHWCFSPSLSPSFPLFLKINKILKKKENKTPYHSPQALVLLPTFSPSSSHTVITYLLILIAFLWNFSLPQIILFYGVWEITPVVPSPHQNISPMKAWPVLYYIPIAKNIVCIVWLILNMK